MRQNYNGNEVVNPLLIIPGFLLLALLYVISREPFVVPAAENMYEVAMLINGHTITSFYLPKAEAEETFDEIREEKDAWCAKNYDTIALLRLTKPDKAVSSKSWIWKEIKRERICNRK